MSIYLQASNINALNKNWHIKCKNLKHQKEAIAKKLYREHQRLFKNEAFNNCGIFACDHITAYTQKVCRNRKSKKSKAMHIEERGGIAFMYCENPSIILSLKLSSVRQ